MVVAGCASTTVTDRQPVATERLPRPNQILVYDFVATPDDVPAESVLANNASVQRTPQTAEQIATGRQVGAEIVTRLVEEIRGMGLSAQRSSSAAKPQINDILIRGYLLAVQQGSTVERMAIGFGAGASE
jgi:hypothetical protein